MIRAIGHFFKLPYLLVCTFWPKPWHFFLLRTWHPWTLKNASLSLKNAAIPRSVNGKAGVHSQAGALKYHILKNIFLKSF